MAPLEMTLTAVTSKLYNLKDFWQNSMNITNEVSRVAEARKMKDEQSLKPSMERISMLTDAEKHNYKLEPSNWRRGREGLRSRRTASESRNRTRRLKLLPNVQMMTQNPRAYRVTAGRAAFWPFFDLKLLGTPLS